MKKMLFTYAAKSMGNFSVSVPASWQQVYGLYMFTQFQLIVAHIASIARKIKSIYRSDWNVQDNVLMAFSESRH